MVPDGECLGRRRYCAASGLPCTFVPNTHCNCDHNLFRAVTERVFGVNGRHGMHGPLERPHLPSDEGLEGLENAALLAAGLIHRRFIPMSSSQFVSCYKGGKRTRYENASRSIMSRPIGPKDAWMQSFVKSEKNNHENKCDGAPRLIQPRNARYNLEVGKFIKPIEHYLYRIIDTLLEGPNGYPSIMKGRNLIERADILQRKWDQFAKPVAISIDASRFDQHVSRGLLEVEHELYLRCFAGSDYRYLAELLEMQLVNQGFAGNLRYSVSGCRMSGDMNTALGNCVLMCLMCFCFKEHLGIQMSIMNDGDDCLLIMEQENECLVRERCHDFFWGFGMDMGMEPPAHCLEDIEFCQARPVYSGVHGKHIFCRDVWKCLSADAGGVVNFQTLPSALKTLHSIGVCGGVLSRGMPVTQVFYRKLRAVSTKGVSLTNESSISHSGLLLHAKQVAKADFSRALTNLHESELAAPITLRTRVSFWRAFGVTPTDQALIEGRLEEWQLDTKEIYDRGPSHVYVGRQLTRVNWENIPQRIG